MGKPEIDGPRSAKGTKMSKIPKEEKEEKKGISSSRTTNDHKEEVSGFKSMRRRMMLRFSTLLTARDRDGLLL